MEHPEIIINQIELLLKELKQVVNTTHNCTQCNHWKNICTLCNSMPPTEVLVVGCKEFDDTVPF